LASNTDYYALIKPAVTDKREIGPINTNMDTIDAALHTLDTGKKSKQSAKTDPTASGTAAAFIDSITQNTNGEITATKKSVRDASTSQSGLMSSADKTKLNGIQSGAQVNPGNATTSAAGLMSAADKTKLNGIANNANNYSLPLAASGTRGGMQIGYSQNGKNYPVQLSSEKAYVNVPWTDTTYSDATTSAHGLMTAADKTKMNGISTGANNGSYSIVSASATNTVLANGVSATGVSITVPSGYTPVAITKFMCGPGTGTDYSNIEMYGFEVQSNSVVALIRNKSSSNLSVTIDVKVLCLKFA